MEQERISLLDSIKRKKGSEEMNYVWRKSPDIVARLVNTQKIQTVVSQEVVLKPNEACALIVDGKIGDIVTETLLKNMAGGFRRWAGDKFGITAKDRRLLFAMTGPMDYWVPFEGQLGNGEKVIGHANLRMRIDLENVPKLLNYFSNNTTTLTRNDIIQVITDELQSRVISPITSSCQSIAELRSSMMIDKFELTTEIQMRNLLSNFGFTLLKAFPGFDRTKSETVMANNAALNSKIKHNESVINSVIVNTKQKEKLKIAKIESRANVARAEARSAIQIELEGELKELRKHEAILETKLKHQQQQHAARNKNQNDKATRTMEMFSMVQEQKAKRISKQLDLKKANLELLTNSQKEIIQIAAKNGVLTPEVIRELLRQQTAQKQIEAESQPE